MGCLGGSIPKVWRTLIVIGLSDILHKIRKRSRKNVFLARRQKTINGDQFPSCNGRVLNSCSNQSLSLYALYALHIPISLWISLSRSFRLHCMCLTRLGLLFQASQPEHSKNLIYHLRPRANTHTYTFTYIDDDSSSFTLTHWQNTRTHCWRWHTHMCTLVHARTHAEVRVCWVLL